MNTHSVEHRISALVLVIAVSVIGVARPASASGKGKIVVPRHQALTINGWVRQCCAVMLMLVACFPAVGQAVGKNKAALVGSTAYGFLQEALKDNRWLVFGPPKLEGEMDTTSGSEFTFDAGKRWSLTVPYTAITELTYGRSISNRAPDGLRMFFPWQGSSQFTNKAHYILTVLYQDQTGSEQCAVFELGRDVVRPMLETLESRTTKAVDFLSVDACMRFKSPEDCGFGSPGELKGLKSVHVDARGNAEYRDNIILEIEESGLDLELVADAQDAEIILAFHGERFWESGKNIDGGRGEIVVVRETGSHVVFLFTDRDTSIWGRAPSINFGREFVKAYKKANER